MLASDSQSPDNAFLVTVFLKGIDPFIKNRLLASTLFESHHPNLPTLEEVLHKAPEYKPRSDRWEPKRSFPQDSKDKFVRKTTNKPPTYAKKNVVAAVCTTTQSEESNSSSEENKELDSLYSPPPPHLTIQE